MKNHYQNSPTSWWRFIRFIANVKKCWGFVLNEEKIYKQNKKFNKDLFSTYYYMIEISDIDYILNKEQWLHIVKERFIGFSSIYMYDIIIPGQWSWQLFVAVHHEVLQQFPFWQELSLN